MEKKLRITDANIVYISEEFRETLGREIRAFDAPHAVLLLPENFELEKTLTSLDLLEKDLQARYGGDSDE